MALIKRFWPGNQEWGTKICNFLRYRFFYNFAEVLLIYNVVLLSSVHKRASLVAQTVKNPHAMHKIWVRSLSQEDPLEKGMANHSTILAWRNPCTEEPGGLQFMGSKRVRHHWATNTFTFLRIFFFYCSGFCHTLKWNSHGFTRVPHPDPPSHLPLHPIPLGLPSAPGLSACLMHPPWAGDLFHPR